MNASTALVRFGERTLAPVGIIALRSRMRENVLDVAAVMPWAINKSSIDPTMN